MQKPSFDEFPKVNKENMRFDFTPITSKSHLDSNRESIRALIKNKETLNRLRENNQQMRSWFTTETTITTRRVKKSGEEIRKTKTPLKVSIDETDTSPHPKTTTSKPITTTTKKWTIKKGTADEDHPDSALKISIDDSLTKVTLRKRTLTRITTTTDRAVTETDNSPNKGILVANKRENINSDAVLEREKYFDYNDLLSNDTTSGEDNEPNCTVEIDRDDDTTTTTPVVSISVTTTKTKAITTRATKKSGSEDDKPDSTLEININDTATRSPTTKLPKTTKMDTTRQAIDTKGEEDKPDAPIKIVIDDTVSITPRMTTIVTTTPIKATKKLTNKTLIKGKPDAPLKIVIADTTATTPRVTTTQPIEKFVPEDDAPDSPPKIIIEETFKMVLKTSKPMVTTITPTKRLATESMATKQKFKSEGIREESDEPHTPRITITPKVTTTTIKANIIITKKLGSEDDIGIDDTPSSTPRVTTTTTPRMTTRPTKMSAEDILDSLLKIDIEDTTSTSPQTITRLPNKVITIRPTKKYSGENNEPNSPLKIGRDDDTTATTGPNFDYNDLLTNDTTSGEDNEPNSPMVTTITPTKRLTTESMATKQNFKSGGSGDEEDEPHTPRLMTTTKVTTTAIKANTRPTKKLGSDLPLKIGVDETASSTPRDTSTTTPIVTTRPTEMSGSEEDVLDSLLNIDIVNTQVLTTDLTTTKYKSKLRDSGNENKPYIPLQVGIDDTTITASPPIPRMTATATRWLTKAVGSDQNDRPLPLRARIDGTTASAATILTTSKPRTITRKITTASAAYPDAPHKQGTDEELTEECDDKTTDTAVTETDSSPKNGILVANKGTNLTSDTELEREKYLDYNDLLLLLNDTTPRNTTDSDVYTTSTVIPNTPVIDVTFEMTTETEVTTNAKTTESLTTTTTTTSTTTPTITTIETTIPTTTTITTTITTPIISGPSTRAPEIPDDDLQKWVNDMVAITRRPELTGEKDDPIAHLIKGHDDNDFNDNHTINWITLTPETSTMASTRRSKARDEENESFILNDNEVDFIEGENNANRIANGTAAQPLTTITSTRRPKLSGEEDNPIAHLNKGHDDVDYTDNRTTIMTTPVTSHEDEDLFANDFKVFDGYNPNHSTNGTTTTTTTTEKPTEKPIEETATEDLSFIINPEQTSIPVLTTTPAIHTNSDVADDCEGCTEALNLNNGLLSATDQSLRRFAFLNAPQSSDQSISQSIGHNGGDSERHSKLFIDSNAKQTTKYSMSGVMSERSGDNKQQAVDAIDRSKSDNQSNPCRLTVADIKRIQESKTSEYYSKECQTLIRNYQNIETTIKNTKIVNSLNAMIEKARAQVDYHAHITKMNGEMSKNVSELGSQDLPKAKSLLSVPNETPRVIRQPQTSAASQPTHGIQLGNHLIPLGAPHLSSQLAPNLNTSIQTAAARPALLTHTEYETEEVDESDGVFKSSTTDSTTVAPSHGIPDIDFKSMALKFREMAREFELKAERKSKNLNPLIISYGFECDNNKTDISDQRIKLYYEYQSLRLKGKVLVEMVSVPLMSFTMHCTAYIPLLGDSTSVAFNWMRETRESVISRFEKQFIRQLVQLLSHGINDLPEELCLKIITYLPYNSIIQLSQTNNFWRYVCDNDTVWHSIYRHKYTAVSYNNAKQSTDMWKNRFKDEYIRLKTIQRRRDEFLRNRSPLLHNRFHFPLRRTRTL
ncbi:unnamed protein product [Medioppia subpectinata]|uniref:F-box domain-containing protein n=1 Tax=Medioppia subpectinata TaxID=1979941 RepID=A0A7R9KED7_9ACAR|nr:unnamed protein product [Medioppia subpectinata]CAG2100586.1 unnamed protein product [Medioppia subpectinata]